jgi:hypothetical protein
MMTENSENNPRSCECFDDWTGRYCERYVFEEPHLDCVNGRYSHEENKCECVYGFTGMLCEHRLRCDNGIIIDNKCVCNDGYSGKYCNMKRPLPIIEQRIQNEIKTRYSQRECIQGQLITINDTTLLEQCVCNRGWSGDKCEEPLCLNGRYNITSDTCECFDNWTGDKCDTSCRKQCSYKGSVCNINQVCECNEGWSGERCTQRNIQQMRTETPEKIEISEDVEITIELNITNTVIRPSVELVECISYDCIPFALKVENISNIQTRYLSSTDELSQNTIKLNMSSFKNENESIIVYKDTNGEVTNKTYDNNIIELPTDESTYMFYVTELVTEPDYANTQNTQDNPTVYPSPYPSSYPSWTPNNDNNGNINNQLNPGSSGNTGNNLSPSNNPTNTNDNNEKNDDKEKNKKYIMIGGFVGLAVICIGVTSFIVSLQQKKGRKNIRTLKHQSSQQDNYVVNPLKDTNTNINNTNTQEPIECRRFEV